LRVLAEQAVLVVQVVLAEEAERVEESPACMDLNPPRVPTVPVAPGALLVRRVALAIRGRPDRPAALGVPWEAVCTSPEAISA
jgi:hypothetical protein